MREQKESAFHSVSLAADRPISERHYPSAGLTATGVLRDNLAVLQAARERSAQLRARLATSNEASRSDPASADKSRCGIP